MEASASAIQSAAAMSTEPRSVEAGCDEHLLQRTQPTAREIPVGALIIFGPVWRHVAARARQPVAPEEFSNRVPILSYRRRPVSMSAVGPGLRRDDDKGGS